MFIWTYGCMCFMFLVIKWRWICAVLWWIQLRVFVTSHANLFTFSLFFSPALKWALLQMRFTARNKSVSASYSGPRLQEHRWRTEHPLQLHFTQSHRPIKEHPNKSKSKQRCSNDIIMNYKTEHVALVSRPESRRWQSESLMIYSQLHDVSRELGRWNAGSAADALQTRLTFLNMREEGQATPVWFFFLRGVWVTSSQNALPLAVVAAALLPARDVDSQQRWGVKYGPPLRTLRWSGMRSAVWHRLSHNGFLKMKPG